jgi:protein NrfC
MDIKNLEKEQNEGIESLPSDERRKFLQMGLAVTGVFLGGTLLSLTSVSTAKGRNADPAIPADGQYPYTKHYGMIMRQNHCVGCEKCMDACVETNNVQIGHGAWRTTIQERLTPLDSGREKREFRPILCNQCNRPPCVRVCPTKATYKDPETGIIVMDDKKCIGCKTCMAACPYNARYYSHAKHAIDKCNFCIDTLLAAGEKQTACVTSCPAHVRVFGDLKDTSSEIYKLLHKPDNKIWVIRPDCGALPNVFYMNA